MKKLYTIFTASLFFFAVNSFSQAITVSMPDTVVVGAISSDIECYKGDTIYNNTPNTLMIDVVRVQNATTPNWTTAFCLNVCYLPTKDSVRFTLQPNQHQGLVVHFYTDATPNTGTCYFKFKNVNTPSNVYYQRFYGTSQLSGINEASVNGTDVNIYPSPVVAGNDFTMNISNVKNTGKEISIIVYDIYGNAVYISTVFKGTNFMNMNLPAGIYSYSLISGNEKITPIAIGAGKIAVSQ